MKTPNFTLVQLRYFAAAAERGSMTAAARDLVVSQSAISTAIAQLEKELGVQLLLRHHARGLTLTPAGREFYTELRGFLAHGQELAAAATNAGQVLAGELRVGCFETLAPFWLPRLVSGYLGQHPEVDVTVIEGEHGELKRALRDGDCEAAVMYGYDLESDLEVVKVAAAQPYVLVAVDHRLATRKRVALADLVDDPMVLLDLPHTATYFRSLFEHVGLDPRIGHRTRGYETVRAMVAAGHGYAVLNQRPVHASTYAGGELVALEISDDLPALDVVVARVAGARPTRKAEAFVRLCVRIGDGRPAS